MDEEMSPLLHAVQVREERLRFSSSIHVSDCHLSRRNLVSDIGVWVELTNLLRDMLPTS